MKINAGFARSVLKRGHDGIEIWLARAARHRSDGQIRDIRAGFTDVRRCAFRQTASRYPDIVSLDDRERETLFVEGTA